MFLRMVAPATLGPAASALRTLASGSAPMVARPPATRPDLRRKLRRSAINRAAVSIAATRPLRRVWRSVLLISTAQPPLARKTVDPVVGLHVIGFLVAGLLFVRVGFGSGGLGGERHRRGHRQACAGAHRAQEVATA